MDWTALLLDPMRNCFNQLMEFIPRLLGALVILGVGWLIAKFIEGLVVQILRAVDKLADQIQITAVLSKGGIKRRFSELVGMIIYWLIMLMVLVTALNALQLTTAAELVQQVFTFLPNVVAALFILIVGLFTATFLATTVRTAASNSGISQANLLGQAVQTSVVIFTLVASLRQLQIQFVGEAFLIILGAIALGLALAFGLGCKDIAGRWVNSVIEELSSRRR